MEPRPYGPFRFVPLPKRPKISWPNGARLAFWVAPNIEFFDLREPMPDDNNQRVPRDKAKIPFVYAWAHRDYGNRVAIWRIMEVMKKHGVRGTCPLNAMVCDYHPEIIEAAVGLGWEMMGHGLTNAVRLNEMPPEQERDAIHRVFETIGNATGKRPRGWLGSGLAETWNTLDFLVEEGCEYICDWVNDDQPYLMDVNGKRLVSIPYSWEANDVLIKSDKLSTDEFELIMRRQFDTLYREGAESGRVMCIALHPFIIGVPHRIESLNRVLGYITSQPDVWVTTASEIMDHYVKAGNTF
jgi:peptidoglycan/xylan/chitin deacetylase (PgdA/CDA1 family)